MTKRAESDQAHGWGSMNLEQDVKKLTVCLNTEPVLKYGSLMFFRKNYSLSVEARNRKESKTSWIWRLPREMKEM